MSEHFKDKTPLEHVLETKAKTMHEFHGKALGGTFFFTFDTARHLALWLSLLYLICFECDLPRIPIILGLFALGALIGYCGRAAWLGWTELERLHRNLQQEHYEISHHRTQERQELAALYTRKGLQGPLLEQVLDVLMADDDRLLRIMLEEEMGFTLGVLEHPLKQSLGALIGGLITIILLGLSIFLLPPVGFIIVSLIIMGFFAALSAYYERNALIPATIWSLGIGSLSLAITHFTFQMIR